MAVFGTMSIKTDMFRTWGIFIKGIMGCIAVQQKHLLWKGKRNWGRSKRLMSYRTFFLLSSISWNPSFYSHLLWPSKLSCEPQSQFSDLLHQSCDNKHTTSLSLSFAPPSKMQKRAKIKSWSVLLWWCLSFFSESA